MTLTAGGPTATLTISQANYTDFFDFGVGNGSTTCPAGTFATSDEYASATSLPIVVAPYAAATCAITIADDTPTAAQISVRAVINVKITGTAPTAGQKFFRGFGTNVDTFDASNPAVTSTFQIQVPSGTESGVGIFGLARGASNNLIALMGDNVNMQETAELVSIPMSGTGTVTPTATLTLPSIPYGSIATDKSGDVYVPLGASGQVNEYSPDLSTLIATLSGSSTGFIADGPNPYAPDGVDAVAVDSSSNVYVWYAHTISEFAALSPGANNTAPIRSLPNTSDVSLTYRAQMLVDASGTLYFTDGLDTFKHYPAGSTAAVAGPQFEAVTSFAIVNGRLFEDTHVPGMSRDFPFTQELGYFDLTNPTPQFVPFVPDDYEFLI